MKKYLSGLFLSALLLAGCSAAQESGSGDEAGPLETDNRSSYVKLEEAKQNLMDCYGGDGGFACGTEVAALKPISSELAMDYPEVTAVQELKEYIAEHEYSECGSKGTNFCFNMVLFVSAACEHVIYQIDQAGGPK